MKHCNVCTPTLLRILLLLLLPVYTVKAQQQVNAVIQPDCVVNYVTTATGSSQTLNNITAGCVNWTISYTSTGFSALSLVVQDAPDSAGAPGAWVTFAGTVNSGTNPNTSTTSATTTFTGYYPWMRVTLSSKTGTGKISATLYGYKNGSSSGSGGGGGGSTTITNLTICNDGSNTLNRSAFTFTTSGNTQIVAASGSTTVYVCGVYATTDAVTFLKLTRGTGSNCGTGTADLTSYPTGTAYNELGFVIDFPLYSTASNAVCINSATAVNGGGTVVYVQK